MIPIRAYRRIPLAIWIPGEAIISSTFTRTQFGHTWQKICSLQFTGMLPSTRNLPSENRKERPSLSQRHHFMPASYFVHGASGMMQPSSQTLLESTNSYQSMTPLTNTMYTPGSLDIGSFDYVSSWLSSNTSYGCNYGPSSTLPMDSFSSFNQDPNVFDAPGNPYIYPNPQYLPWMDSVREADSLAHGQHASNLTSSDCATPLMENDVSLDLDLTGDPLITPSESAGFPWNGSIDTINLPYPGLCGNIDTHKYNLASSEAQSPVENFPITVDSDDTIVYTHYGPNMRLNYPEILQPGQTEQQDMSFGADAESWRCEVPGCGKTFDKRHRFKYVSLPRLECLPLLVKRRPA